MEFNYVHKGQRIEIPTAAFHNAVVDILRLHLSGRKGFTSNIASAFKETWTRRKTIEVTASEDIEEFSIFTIAGANPFDLHIPVVTSEVITSQTDANAVYVTNADVAMASGSTYLCWIVGDEMPHLARFSAATGTGTGSTASIGDELGAVSGDYTVEIGTGLIAVSSLDEEENLIWVVRSYGAAEKLIELCALEDAERGVPYNCLKGTWNPDENRWCYDNAPTVKAIDWRVGPPYAEVGWKGLYQKKPSTDYGTIYDNVSLDCELPPEGCNECLGTGT